MSTLADYMRSDLSAIVGELPITVTHQGKTFQAARTAFRRENNLGDGGFMSTVSMSITTAYDTTTQLIQLGDILTIDGAKFRVLSAELSQDAVSVDFSLEDLNK